ncbi:VUT family protein [Legionella bononiensis]|uniref:VUT family protein n=1 Tax=Legionella bononiensis TaxID=2793102 RepID=A0ABS1WG01_9GAMM|nr:VUT family protein [Legionella bononiensis]MBL7481712.1 VUT family protein [Legionella bononiensis]MBL7528260.1 VUT family protein [Legionella bononiensis]MBL7562735.1 VUT family protein [Legionella bononiensis]
MKQSLSSQHTSGFLFLSVSVITCLILLINVSFKIIILQGLVFSISSLLCPLIAGLYLFALRHCTFKEQRHLLNISLMTLYMYCIGVYVLVNLPAAEFMHDNPVYQIVFEDIPKKFFATTISFALSFYLPHLLLCSKTNTILSSPKQCVILAIFGGVAFFTMDFYLLFSAPHAHSFKQIFIDSFMVASLVLLIIGVSYLSFVLDKSQSASEQIHDNPDESSPVYHYLLCFAVAVMLMCLACEYRIVSFTKDSILAASCIFFPITMIVSTVIGELWGYKANLKLALAMIAAQLVFDTLLMGIVALPSPPFYNLNPFYYYILPRRLPAASLSLFVTFLSNAMLLHYLKFLKWELNRPVRILIANICASSLLCLVDYSVLFGGIYSYEQILNLAINVWQYKLMMTLISLPLIFWLCNLLKKNFTPVCRVMDNRINYPR